MRSLVATVASITAATLLWAAPAPAATAKTPPPPVSLATNTVDAHLGYMKQTTCSPSAKPGTTALLKALISTWGGSSSGISRACSVGSTSEHKEGRALDWHMNVRNSSQRKRVDAALRWMTANNGEVAYRIGVMYIIWNQRIWSVYYPELGWRKMADRGSYTANHKDHVHISLTWDGAMKQTSWWTGVPVTQPLNSRCGVNGARACLPTVRRTSKDWPYQDTEVPASFLPAPWTRPGIGGGPQVGRTLTVVPGTWVPEGATLAYQWVAGQADIPGATDATFEVTPDQLGKAVRVRVTATAADGTPTTMTSDGTTEVLKARFATAPRPALAGTVAVDQVVTVDPGEWAPAPDSLTYTWKRNGRAVKGASGVDLASYTVTPADRGDKLSVTITARRRGYYTKSTTSTSVKVAAATFATVGEPTISGDAVVGATLTAAPGTWAPEATIRYQWYVSGSKVDGATRSTFALSAKRLGKEVLVRVRASRPGYVTRLVRSTPVVVAAAP